jgi:transketolase
MASMRKAYGEALVDLGREHRDVVVLSADVSNSDFSFVFQEAFPDRFFNVGIAEQCLVDVAAGFAYAGRIPLANTFAFLFATRALEMVRTHLCYGRANVKLMAAYSGLSDSFDGPTHHSINDLAIMRSLPNMTVVVPSDCTSLKRLLPQIAAWEGPVYCRLNRNDVPSIFTERHQPEIGKAVWLREGPDVALIGTGLMVSFCLDAADGLAEEGIEASVVEIHTIKPLDIPAVLSAAQATGAVVTAEEHSVLGGLGGAVAEVLGECCPVPMRLVGIQDTFAESGPYFDLLEKYGLSAERIACAAREAVKRKEQFRVQG